MPTNAINDTGVKYLYDKLHDEIEPVAEAVSDREVTIEGNPLNFNTLSAQNAKSTILSVEPIQDLHGYDKPWVGGAGKNKFDYSTCTNNSIANDGTLQPRSDRLLSEIFSVNANTAYIISFPSNIMFIGHIRYDSSDNYVERVLVDSSTSPTIFTPTTGRIRLYFSKIPNTENISPSDVATVQCEQGTTATAFEPYENICPISGRSEIGILGCGKNLLTEISGGAYNSDGSDFPANNRCKTPIFKIDTDTNYTLTGATTQNKTLQGRIQKWKNNSYTENVLLSETDWANLPISYTNSADSYISIAFRYSSNDNISYTNLTAQLELGSSATDYEPYTKSNDLTISLGQTVYGGTLDVENGVLVVDRHFETLTANAWNYQRSGTVGDVYSCQQITKVYNGSAYMMSNIVPMPTNTTSQYYGNELGICWANTGHINISVPKGTPSENIPLTVQVCYELETPITINLTPHTIKLLEGVNNISVDDANATITLTYRDGKVATLGDLTSAVDSLDGKIEDSKILTDTATGDKYILVVTNGVLDIQQVSN